MNALKGVGGIVVTILLFAVLVLVYLLVIHGLAWVSEIVIPWLATAAGFTFWFFLLLALPFSFFKKTRLAAMWAMMVSSFVFGALACVWGFLTTYTYWGAIGVVIGFIFAGIGIVPVGILAAMFHGDWTTAFWLIGLMVFTFVIRSYSLYVANRIDQEAMEQSFLELKAK